MKLLSNLSMILILISLWACKQEHNPRFSKSNFITIHSKDEAHTLSTQEFEIPVSVSTRSTFSNPESNIYTIYAAVDEIVLNNVFGSIQSILTGDIPDNVIPIAFVLYLNEFSSEINESDLTGLSLFNINNENLEHRYFKITDLIYARKLSELRTTTRTLSTGDLDNLLYYSLNYNPIANPSYLFLETEAFREVLHQQNINTSLSKVILDHLPFNKISAKKGCSSPCKDNSDGTCEIDEFGGEICNTCAGVYLAEEAKRLGLKELADIIGSFSIPTARDFKENFLNLTIKGRSYIDRYYNLSYLIEAHQLINRDNINDHISLVADLYEIAENLQNGNNSQIIISEKLTLKTLELISYYAGSTKNPEFQSILQSVQEDIIYLNGKTRAEVLNFLNGQ